MKTSLLRISCCVSPTASGTGALAFASFTRNVKGFAWNHKRLYRIYRELELNLRIKPKKRLCSGQLKPEALAVPAQPNYCWSMDFMHDQLSDGRSVRLTLGYIQQGNPQHNVYIERFNRTVRYDWLAHHLFGTLEDLQEFSTQWLWVYNHERPIWR